MRVRELSRAGGVLLAVAALLFATSAEAFIFDTYGDGFWTVINQGNGNTLVVNGTGASQAVVTNTPFQQQFELLYNEADGTFRIRNHDSWLCIGALNGGTAAGTPVVTLANYTGASSQRWNLVNMGSGNFQIVNVASGLALQTDNGSPANVTLATSSTSTFQYWHFTYQTAYPKKGLAGWDSQLPRFNASWLYNWGWITGQPLNPNQVFAPMQWGNWGVGGLNANLSGPQEVLTFNEPDHTDQANMTTDQAIALWPSLQALNLPLVSPACANDFGGWLQDFYNKIAANGYRVDYTAYHWYANPNASSLMSTLQSAYNTWGRAVWLTEFAPVDWSGTATWSEQDNYRFLAEFMWQAEDQVWLKRYSLFLFSGTPSVNPWDGNGHRGDTFLNDNYTLTPFGELYAGWDADLTVHTNQPYFIHNAATCFRMASVRNVAGPAGASIRHEDASTQWTFISAPTGYYLQSLADGRRLRYSGGVLDLAPPGTTGTVVQWTFNGPDGNGYYFIDNSASVTLSASGSGGSVGFSAVAAGSPSDNTRFRFVKPYYPASLAAVTAPTALTATAANRSVMLHWTGSAPRYNIYRSTISGGAYTKIASDIKWGAYTDNTAVNGVPYYYVVTALDSLENESGNSNQAQGTPASGAGLGLVAEYKFENGAQDTSGNGYHGIVNGVTSVVGGQVDSSAINFTGGDNSYVEIPNPLGNDFSIAFWVQTTATAGTGQWYNGEGLVDGEVPGATNDFGVALVGGQVGFGIGNPDTTILSTTAVNDGNWHHVVATRTSANGLMQLYVDGQLQITGTGSTATRSTPVSLHLGNLQSGAGYFPGSIDEVRLYNYVVTPATVTQLYSLGSTLVAYYNLDGNAADSSGFGNNGTIFNNVTFVPGKVGAQAAQFDGLSSYIQIPVATVNDFSITYWVKTTATGPAGQWWQGDGLVDGETPGAVNDFGTSLVGSGVAFGVGNPDTTITSLRAINDGLWHHVTATRDNVSGLMKLYVDGTLQSSITGPVGTRSAPSALRLGGIQTGGGFFPGTLDDVRFYNYELSTSQIAALVAHQPLPPPWTNTDIGNPASPGYANYAAGTWTLGGGGSDIWQTADQFQLAYTNFAGSGSLITQLTSGALISDGTTNANAKAGIMFRDSLAANAPFVALLHDQSQGLQFSYRDTPGAIAAQQGANVATNPAVWLRLTRSNNTFTAWYATSASPPPPAVWILIGTHTTTIANAAFAGLAVCSHNPNRLANAIFASVTISPPTPPTISSVADQVINENTATAVLPVTLGDALVTGSNLVLTASSSSPLLVPNANLTLGGSGNARNVQVTPSVYQSGSATITLVVNNGQPAPNTATNSFLVTVQTSAAGAWRQEYFNTTQNAGIAADGANPSGDGIVNIMKRFQGLDPLVVYPSTSDSSVAVLTNNLVMNYTHSLLATDLTWQVWGSPDLTVWWTNNIQDVPVATNGSVENRTATIPTATHNPLFLRLQVAP
jgi:hypothetical protein